MPLLPLLLLLFAAANNADSDGVATAPPPSKAKIPGPASATLAEAQLRRETLTSAAMGSSRRTPVPATLQQVRRQYCSVVLGVLQRARLRT